MQVPATLTSSIEGLKQHGLRIFCVFLTALCAVEGTRMLLQSRATDARWGGWYLLVVGLLISFGIFAKETDGTDQSRDTSKSAHGSEASGDDQMASRTPMAEEPNAEPVQKRTRYAAIFFAAALVYAWALPWVGFAIANALFVAAYLLIIDKQRWFVAVGIAVVVDVVLVIGMGLLGVFLPTGVYGLSF
jgi:hypothetical protein